MIYHVRLIYMDGMGEIVDSSDFIEAKSHEEAYTLWEDNIDEDIEEKDWVLPIRIMAIPNCPYFNIFEADVQYFGEPDIEPIELDED